MALPDVILSLILPTLILLHLFIAPYTKVEESFNIQAAHDISSFLSLIPSLPTLSSPLSTGQFDHILFPGAVPRTFVGASLLATLSMPFIYFFGLENEVFWPQVLVRGILGLVNAGALLWYKNGLVKAYGNGVGRWWDLLIGSQFHVVYYASRTLPNMFAFTLTTLALRECLPLAGSPNQHQKKAIYFFVLAGVIFRSEIALLLATQLGYLLVQSAISLRTIILSGLYSAGLALAITVPVDSYFWQKPIWPEFAGFYFNAIQGKSAEWGTSPFGYYFSHLLPRLLLNPLIPIFLIPFSFILPSTKFQARNLVVPSILFIGVYSLQPHKESRFIIYVVPPLTAAASLSASYIWTRRSKNLLYRLASFLLAVSVLGSFVASTTMLLISSLNYPGGEALSQLHSYMRSHPDQLVRSEGTNTIRVHMDVLSCMTGITRFQQYDFDSPLDGNNISQKDLNLPYTEGRQMKILYDKTETEETLLLPAFWAQVDYALMEEPGKAIGAWEVIGTVYAYAGIEFLKPEYFGGWGGNLKEFPTVFDDLEEIYAANNSTIEDRVRNSKNVRMTIDEGVFSRGGKKIWNLAEFKKRAATQELTRFGIYNLVRDVVRSITGGYWVGPKMEPKIRILERLDRIADHGSDVD